MGMGHAALYGLYILIPQNWSDLFNAMKTLKHAMLKQN